MSLHHIPHTLERDLLGRLVLTDASGNRHEGVYPVRAFPITAPNLLQVDHEKSKPAIYK
jgi:hypothetical protein